MKKMKEMKTKQNTTLTTEAHSNPKTIQLSLNYVFK